MTKAVFESYNHVTCSDELPMQGDCPGGQVFYCFMKKHEVSGATGPPPSHSTMNVRCILDEKDRHLVR